MHPFRFVHAADLHLDSPFSGLSAVAPEVGERLRRAPFEAVSRLVDLCLREEVDFLLLAGDLYDGAHRSLRAQLFLRDELGRLAARRIPTFIVHGNHDPTDGWNAKIDWPDGVYIFSDDRVQSLPVWSQAENGDRREIARVYGVSHGNAHVRENLARRFQREDDAPYAIALLHADVDGASESEHHPYAPCKLTDLLEGRFDYWALGHIHSRRILHEADPLVVYPGNPQGRSRRESGPRGCMLVDVASSGKTTARFLATDAVRWETETISIDGMEREQELLDGLDGCVERVRERTLAEGRSALLRIRVEGRGPLHHVLRRRSNREEFLEQLRGGSGRRDPFTWVDSLEVRTAPNLDEDALADDPDFLGAFVRLVRRNRDALKEANTEVAAAGGGPEGMAASIRTMEGFRGALSDVDVNGSAFVSPDSLTSALQPLYGNRRAKRYLDPITPDELGALLLEAERLGVELLMGDGETRGDEE